MRRLIVILTFVIGVMSINLMTVFAARSAEITAFGINPDLSGFISITCPTNSGFAWRVIVDYPERDDAIHIEDTFAKGPFRLDVTRITNGNHVAIAKAKCEGETWDDATWEADAFYWDGNTYLSPASTPTATAEPTSNNLGGQIGSVLSPIATVTVQPPCGLALQSRMIVGYNGRSTDDGAELNMRKAPGTDKEVVTKIPNGGEFMVLAGPECVQGMYWWNVQYDALQGYIAEGDESSYYVEPSESAPGTENPTLQFWGYEEALSSGSYIYASTFTNHTNMNVYVSPDEDSQSLGYMLALSFYPLITTQGEWIQILSQFGHIGWIKISDDIAVFRRD